MPVIIFPYRFYHGIYSPIIDLGLKSKIGWRKVWAYVDSGSIYSIFQEAEAERLHIDIESGSKEYVKVGDGDTFPAYLHPLEVQIRDQRFSAQIGFSRSLKVGFNILGRQDIFKKFKVCFDDLENVVSFYPKA